LSGVSAANARVITRDSDEHWIDADADGCEEGKMENMYTCDGVSRRHAVELRLKEDVKEQDSDKRGWWTNERSSRNVSVSE